MSNMFKLIPIDDKYDKAFEELKHQIEEYENNGKTKFELIITTDMANHLSDAQRSYLREKCQIIRG